MKYLLLLLWLLPALGVAQGVVNVNNRGLSPQQLVLDPGGSPLVGTNFVAQILYGATPETVTNELGSVMPFRVPTTSIPGTWNPGGQGIRMVPGFPSGTAVWMKIRVWDRSVFPASPGVLSGSSRVPCGVLYGESLPFSVTLGSPGQAASGSLVSFTGFQLSSWSGGPCDAGTKVFEVRENEPPVFIPESETFFYSSNESQHLAYFDERVGMLTTTNGGWWFEGRPNSYGLFQQIYRPGVIFAPPSAQEYGGLLIFRVTPSPRRPFLDLARTSSRPALTMRGLPPRRYGIEGSTNLTGWTRLGELSLGEDGNAPVPDAWLDTNATQFVRFVPLP